MARYGAGATQRLRSADVEVLGALLMDIAAATILIGGGATLMASVKKLEPPAPPATAMAQSKTETPAEKKLKSAHAAALAAIIVGAVGGLGGLAYFGTARVNRNGAGAAPRHQCTMSWVMAVLRLGMAGSAGALGGLGLDMIVEHQCSIEQMSSDDQKHFKSAQGWCAASLAALGAQVGGAAIAVGHAACRR